jgi:hypothetical protein
MREVIDIIKEALEMKTIEGLVILGIYVTLRKMLTAETERDQDVAVVIKGEGVGLDHILLARVALQCHLEIERELVIDINLRQKEETFTTEEVAVLIPQNPQNHLHNIGQARELTTVKIDDPENLLAVHVRDSPKESLLLLLHKPQ